MTDKVNFLKFFFDSGKYAEPSSFISSITDFFPALIFVYRVDSHRIEYVNSRFTEFFGLTYHDIRRDRNILTNLVCKEDFPRFKDAFDQLYQAEGTKTVTFMCRLNDKEAEGRNFRIHGTILKQSEEDEEHSVLLVAQDIAEELKNNEETQALKKLFDEAEDRLHFGSWTLSVYDHTMTWTPGMINLLEYDQDELKAPLRLSFYLKHVVNGYKNALAEMIDQAVDTCTDFEYEYVIQTRNGKLKTFFTNGKAIKSAAGDVERIMGITRDVTTLRNFEKEQDRHIRQLNKSNKDLEEFAYIASHDLQEPLRKIDMYGERLRLKFGDSLDQEGEQFLSRILGSAASMKSLIDNLLEFSRSNNNSGNFILLDFKLLLDQVIADLELKIEETQSRIWVSGILPGMEAVPSEMKQLFTNLLSNAIKFRKNGVPPAIEIAARKLTREEKKIYHLPSIRTFYKIDISDNGIGFEEEHADKIFQIFHRLHGKVEYPGSGIGLAICKKITENHNGIIFAHGIPNEGATFTVILPEKQF